MEKFEREKNQLLAVAKDIAFNENESAQTRLSGVKILIEDCCYTIAKKQIGLERLYQYEKTLVEKLIKEYKEKRIVEFMTKFSDKDLTPDMIIEMKKIDKPSHCYSVEGITVIEKDCNLCNRKSCEMAGVTLQYKLEIEEELIEKPTDGLDGTQ